MGKLHENLAVEKSLESTAKKLILESIKTMSKENLFLGSIKKFEMFDSDKDYLNTSDTVNLESTVDENIDYVMPHLASWYDGVLQKDLTNQLAVADILMPDGTVLATGLPATFLLGLEAKLTALRELYVRIPTLAPGIPWVKDETNAKPGVFITSQPAKSFKTEKDLDFRIVVEPTEFHPAQIKEVQRTVNIGHYEITKTCGMLTPVEKARRIDNLDTLAMAVRKARMRANGTKLVVDKVGMVLLDFINK